jgi:hypothetical protein
MTTLHTCHRHFAPLLALLFLLLGQGFALRAQPPTGTIEGRVFNPSTGAILERARITIEGTKLETFTDADGYYRLSNVPPGTAQVRAFFTGFPPATANVTVIAGQPVQRDFELSPVTSSVAALAMARPSNSTSSSSRPHAR